MTKIEKERIDMMFKALEGTRKGESDFFCSLQEQWLERGSLSPKQVACLEKMFEEET